MEKTVPAVVLSVAIALLLSACGNHNLTGPSRAIPIVPATDIPTIPNAAPSGLTVASMALSDVGQG